MKKNYPIVIPIQNFQFPNYGPVLAQEVLNIKLFSLFSGQMAAKHATECLIQSVLNRLLKLLQEY